MSELALILFDVDGTLVNSRRHILLAMQSAFGSADMPCPSDAEIMDGIGLSLPILMRRLCPEASAEQVNALVEGYKSSFLKTRNHVSQQELSPLYDGIAEALSDIETHSHWLLGIATGKSRRGLDHLVRRHGWDKRFLTLQCADGHPSKPHPSMVLSAMAEVGALPSRTVVIGDTTYDVEMAGAAGARAIGVSWGYHSEAALMDAGAAALVREPADLTSVLCSLLESGNG